MNLHAMFGIIWIFSESLEYFVQLLGFCLALKKSLPYKKSFSFTVLFIKLYPLINSSLYFKIIILRSVGFFIKTISKLVLDKLLGTKAFLKIIA